MDLTLISDMIRAGVDPDLVARVSNALIACTHSTGIPVDSAAEKRRAWDRERKRNAKAIPPDSTGIPQNSENASISKDLKKRERQNSRGTRIPADWTLTDGERTFAKAEGFSDWEIQREVQKFRDYWAACAGSKGVKLDWPATWRQWIRSGADRAGKKPAPTSHAPGPTTSGFYAQAESEQLAAWDAYTQRTTGKLLPRDRNFGWHVKSEWPPDYEQAPLLRAMP